MASPVVSRLFGMSLLILCAVSVSAGKEDRRKVMCRLPEFFRCFKIRALCPLECPFFCFMDCNLCRPVCNCDRPGAVCQDPRFVGGDGITFYFHGQKDSDFCLVTDPGLHINAHFIGKRKPSMTRDFTWVQSLGILIDGRHKLYVGARKTGTWDDASDRLELAFDGEAISLPTREGAKWQSKAAPHISVARTRDANSVTLESAGKFAINAAVVPITEKESKVHGYNITDEDCFAHLELMFKFYGLSDDVHGVLGQTYRTNYTSKINVGAMMPVLGREKEFSSSDIFSTDCAVSRFTKNRVVGDGPSNRHAAGAGEELPSMQCSSGASGRGVVCKR